MYGSGGLIARRKYYMPNIDLERIIVQQSSPYDRAGVELQRHISSVIASNRLGGTQPDNIQPRSVKAVNVPQRPDDGLFRDALYAQFPFPNSSFPESASDGFSRAAHQSIKTHKDKNPHLRTKREKSNSNPFVLGSALVASGALALSAMFGGNGAPTVASAEPEVLTLDGEGISNISHQEEDWHIAGEGSCSPYTSADANRAVAGEFTPRVDLLDAQVAFLRNNPAYARNLALSSEARIGNLWDALNIPRPSANPGIANRSITRIFDNDYYVTAPLAEPEVVQNTYCDDQGNVLDYRTVTLEEGTFVGGVIINGFGSSQGSTTAELANGQVIALDENSVIARVRLSNGQVVDMLATHKAGIDVNGDNQADVGCLNIITSPGTYVSPDNPDVVITVHPDGSTTTTTSPNTTTTTQNTTTSSTTTTMPTTTTTNPTTTTTTTIPTTTTTTTIPTTTTTSTTTTVPTTVTHPPATTIPDDVNQ